MAEQLIETIKAFVKVNRQDADLINGLFTTVKIAKHDFFLKEGQICRRLGFLNKGLVRYYLNVNGEEKIYAFAAEHDFVCNYESFIPQVASAKIIQAVEDTELRVISYANLQKLYKKMPGAERFGRLIIEQLFIQTLRDLNSFYSDSPEERYKKFLEKYPAIQQRVPQYYIASFVGVQPQSLSRIRKRLLKQS